MTQRAVAVIGAGIAGLACARELARAGLQVRVFDKGRSPGGRCSTRRHPPLQFDHGAQYFTVRDPRLEGQLRAWMGEGVAAPWAGGSPSPAGGGELESDNLPAIVVLERGGITPTSPDAPRFVGVPGMSSIAASMARGLSVRTGVQVWRVSRDGPSWRLFDPDGNALGMGEGGRHAAFDAVVVAIPPSQAATLLAPWRQLAEPCNGVRMLPCWAAMVAFDRPTGLAFDGAFVRSSPLAWIARDSAKPGRAPTAEQPAGDAPGGRPAECWVLHATHEWSARHLELTPEAAGERLRDAFAEAAGRDLPAPSFTLGHRWRHARPENPLPGPCLLGPDLPIGLCGDWFGATPEAGRIETAYLSGLALGESLVGRLREK